jgi:hypothetical protein
MEQGSAEEWRYWENLMKDPKLLRVTVVAPGGSVAAIGGPSGQGGAIASRIAGTPIPDAQTGLRAFTSRLAAEVAPRISRYTRYEYEAAFLLTTLRAGYGVRSVTIPTIYDGQPSHFRSVADGWRVARVFARYLLGAS